jgi:hypothetical protein
MGQRQVCEYDVKMLDRVPLDRVPALMNWGGKRRAAADRGRTATRWLR